MMRVLVFLPGGRDATHHDVVAIDLATTPLDTAEPLMTLQLTAADGTVDQYRPEEWRGLHVQQPAAHGLGGVR